MVVDLILTQLYCVVGICCH